MNDPREKDATGAQASGPEAAEPMTDDQPTVNLKRDGQQTATPLPTSDPVFPTSSPQLRPPAPADVSGFGAPGGSAPAHIPSGSTGTAAGTPAPAGQAAGVAPRQPPPPRPPRTAKEIRADIEAGRQELSQSVEVLRDKVNELTDWRGQVRKHRRELTVAAAVVGFAVGARLMLRRRR